MDMPGERCFADYGAAKGKMSLSAALESGPAWAVQALVVSGARAEGLVFETCRGDWDVKVPALAKAFERLRGARGVAGSTQGVAAWLAAIEALMSAGASPADCSYWACDGRPASMAIPAWEEFFLSFEGVRSLSEEELLAPTAARLMLAAGWDPDMPGLFGRTPLHWAALMGMTSVARTLLKAGAKADAVDESQKTPEAHAWESDRGDLARLLRACAEYEALRAERAHRAPGPGRR